MHKGIFYWRQMRVTFWREIPEYQISPPSNRGYRKETNKNHRPWSPSVGIAWGLFCPIRDEVTATINSAGIAIVTLKRKSFAEIANVLMCSDKMMPVVVAGCHQWAGGASEHMSKACPGENTVPQPSQASAETVSLKAPDGVWMKVSK